MPHLGQVDSKNRGVHECIRSMSYSCSVQRHWDTYVEKSVYIQCTEARRGTTSQADAQGCQGLSGVNVFVELRMVKVVWYRIYGTVRAQKVGIFDTK